MKQASMESLVKDYLAMRRKMGFALEVQGYQLLRFAQFADVRGHRGPITLELATKWAHYKASRPITWTGRIEILRPFAKYRAQFDPATEVPPSKFLGSSRQRLAPHIYTDEEVQSILVAASKLSPCGGVRPAAYETLYGLLAATGLRISEALRLKIPDVDLEAGIITVRETKFKKSRLVPLHPTTTKALKRYTHIREDNFVARPYKNFFLLEGGHRVEKDTAQRRFRHICNQLHLRARGGHPTPRIQDLRHSFITHCIQRWYHQGIDVDKEMLTLSTYVGHAEVTYTYWYITGVPELMAIAAQRFEHFAAVELT